tara:strand:- start:315 stop:1574 length:1260 start_codon:yes stop_codon:yes gene_type:complete
MPSDFKATNSTTNLRNLYIQRSKYYANAMIDQDGNRISGVVDNNAFEYIYYGKTDLALNSIWPIRENIIYGNDISVRGLDIAVDAFEEFRRDIKLSLKLSPSNLGFIDSDPYLSNIKCFKSYNTDSEILYNSHIQNIYVNFYNSLQTNKLFNNITDFESFVKFFLIFFQRNGKNIPLTRTAWQKSKYSNIFSTGLVFSITDLDCGDDTKKQSFIESPNFELYLQRAQDNGFNISLQCPWLMFFNPLSSSYKLRPNSGGPGILANRGINNPRETYNVKYYRLYKEEIYNIKNILIKLYNLFTRNYPYIKTTKFVCGKTVKCNVLRQQINNESFNKFLSIDDLINFLIDVKNVEENKGFGPAEMARLKNKAIFYYKNVDIYRSMSYINKQFLSTFYEKEGGINYFFFRQAKKQEKLEQQET